MDGLRMYARSPWEILREMEEGMNRLFEKVFGYNPFDSILRWPLLRPKGEGAYRQPVTELQETDKEIVALFEIPGVEKGDIEVYATQDGIKVRAEKKYEKKEEDKGKGISRHEEGYNRYEDFISLPDADLTNPGNIKATYKNGILQLNVPKKPRIQIEVKSPEPIPVEEIGKESGKLVSV